MVIGDLLAAANVVLSLILAVLSWRTRRRERSWQFLRPLFVLTAMYWAAIYVFVLIAQPGGYNPVFFGQVFIRPAFTWTLALMAAHALIRVE